MKKNNFKVNGEKGGRPKSNTYLSTFIIPGFDTIILTERQYNTLLKKYGIKLIKYAFTIFENWLVTSPVGYKYKGKNNYAHFRADGWVINEAILATQQT